MLHTKPCVREFGGRNHLIIMWRSHTKLVVSTHKKIITSFNNFNNNMLHLKKIKKMSYSSHLLLLVKVGSPCNIPMVHLISGFWVLQLPIVQDTLLATNAQMPYIRASICKLHMTCPAETFSEKSCVLICRALNVL